jgi:hypothetical protein
MWKTETERTHAELEEATMRKLSQSVTALGMHLTLAVDREWTGSAALLPNHVPLSPSSDDTPLHVGPSQLALFSSTLPLLLHVATRIVMMHSHGRPYPVVKHFAVVPWEDSQQAHGPPLLSHCHVNKLLHPRPGSPK